MIKHKMKFFKQKVSFRNALVFIFGTLSLLSLAWIGDQSYFAIYDKDDYEKSALIFSSIAFIVFSLATAFMAFNFVKVRDLSGKVQVNKVKVLIIAASPLGGRFKIAKHQGAFKLYQRTQPVDKKGNRDYTPYEEVYTFSGNLDLDIESLQETKPNWQQTLRAIRAHKGVLDKIVIVASKELREFKFDEQSHLDVLIEWLQTYGSDPSYQEEQFSVERHHALVDKDDMNEYYTAFDYEIDKAHLKYANEKLINIDITGGQITASIGGSLATLHNNCAMQYVNNDGEVKVYDAYIKQVDAKQ